MISPRSAVQVIKEHSSTLPLRQVSIDDALGNVLAEDVTSPMDFPRFDNSAMDGYAVRAKDTVGGVPDRPVRLSLTETVYAGDRRNAALAAGTACGIMTGAPVPRGADAIIPVEQAIIDGNELVVEVPPHRGRHIRHQGEEIKRGARVLRSGSPIHPGTIACLAALGKSRVRVVPMPRVSIIATGNETVSPGHPLRRGEIYDSNTHMLKAMLKQMGIEAARVRRVRDHPTALANAVTAALHVSDVLVVVGGVSMGEKDYLRPVLKRLRVRERFWRVAQKPGKPLYFGTRGRRLVFGLPGNPASAFTCFYVYVYPALRRLAGVRHPGLNTARAPIEASSQSDPHKWRFLKATSSRSGVVSILPHQGSHMITSLQRTNSLVVLPPEANKQAGDLAETYSLPYSEDVHDID